MSKQFWLQFAGLLNGCIYQLNHQNCPFNEYRSMDHYQRMEFLLSVSYEKANMMMGNCLCKQKECTPLMFQKEPSGWGVAIAG
jgi:hypothetical protein